MVKTFWEEIKEDNIDDTTKMKANEETIDIEHKIQNEISTYLTELRINSLVDPFKYWQKNKERYPHLSYIASKYLFIPASSAYFQRIFKESGNIITDKRTLLTDEHANQLLFLNKNI